MSRVSAALRELAAAIEEVEARGVTAPPPPASGVQVAAQAPVPTDLDMQRARRALRRVGVRV